MNAIELRTEARRLAAEQQVEDDKHSDDYWARSREYDKAAKRWLRTMRNARSEDYSAWLDGYLLQGGVVDHVLNYQMRTMGRWFVARKQCVITKLYGAKAVNVIVPIGVDVTIEEAGHNGVFFMDGFATESHVMLFKDT